MTLVGTRLDRLAYRDTGGRDLIAGPSELHLMIGAGKIIPLIMVLPQGDDGYWVNQANNGPRWGDYVAQDVVRSVDTSLPTLADRDHRAIGGLLTSRRSFQARAMWSSPIPVSPAWMRRHPYSGGARLNTNRTTRDG